jgi:hypothetical protein
MLWYHDHAIGQTRLNVYAGLAGIYLIRDDTEDALGLPGGGYELPLLIQDRTCRRRFNCQAVRDSRIGPENPAGAGKSSPVTNLEVPSIDFCSVAPCKSSPVT